MRFQSHTANSFLLLMAAHSHLAIVICGNNLIRLERKKDRNSWTSFHIKSFSEIPSLHGIAGCVCIFPWPQNLPGSWEQRRNKQALQRVGACNELCSSRIRDSICFTKHLHQRPRTAVEWKAQKCVCATWTSPVNEKLAVRLWQESLDNW